VTKELGDKKQAEKFDDVNWTEFTHVLVFYDQSLFSDN
jgi:hypothetical protein